MSSALPKKYCEESSAIDVVDMLAKLNKESQEDYSFLDEKEFLTPKEKEEWIKLRRDFEWDQW